MKSSPDADTMTTGAIAELITWRLCSSIRWQHQVMHQVGNVAAQRVHPSPQPSAQFTGEERPWEFSLPSVFSFLGQLQMAHDVKVDSILLRWSARHGANDGDGRFVA